MSKLEGILDKPCNQNSPTYIQDLTVQNTHILHVHTYTTFGGNSMHGETSDNKVP